jgi:CheY-like chemotaxis protein
MYQSKYFLYAGTDSNEIDVLEKVLNSIDRGKQIVAVPNGFDLISFLQQVGKGESYPLLIILNLEMERLNGRSTLELLKSDDIYCLIPTIMLTPEERSEDRSFCISLGTEVIVKPSTRAGWVSAVKQLCANCE